jgi:hypothetical protein
MIQKIGNFKFAILFIALGVFSPHMTSNNSTTTLTLSKVEFSLFNRAEARDDNRNVNINRNKNKNTNINVNRNKNTNVNVNVNRDKRRPSPIGVLAGMAIGTVVAASAMSPSCTTVVVNNVRYRKCDNTYYQPQGSNYIVVKSPY